MKKLTTFVLGDLRLVFRDRMLSLFFFAPILLILFVRLLVPYITAVYPLIETYHPYIMMFASLQTAILFGFITSFMILEEKDEHVIEVIRILPVSSSFFILYRMLFGAFFSALGAFLIISLGRVAYPGLLNSILLSLQYGLVAPLITLIVGTFAQNKIEGMAWFKGINLLLILPVLFFFLTGLLKYLFALIPVFWTYLLYDVALSNDHVEVVFSAGIGVYLIVLFVLFVQFKKRVFGR
jgi:fluoroquinolone transport system permease protein